MRLISRSLRRIVVLRALPGEMPPVRIEPPVTVLAAHRRHADRCVEVPLSSRGSIERRSLRIAESWSSERGRERVRNERLQAVTRSGA